MGVGTAVMLLLEVWLLEGGLQAFLGSTWSATGSPVILTTGSSCPFGKRKARR